MTFKPTLQLIFIIIAILLCCIMIWVLIYALYQIANFFKEKQKLTIQTRNKTEYELLSLRTGTAYNLAYKIKTTEELLTFIENSIDIEVGLIIRNLQTLHQKYDVKNMDEDIKNISSRIFQSFHGSVYTSNEIVITEDYLMKYIVEFTTTDLIKSVSELNNMIYFDTPIS